MPEAKHLSKSQMNKALPKEVAEIYEIEFEGKRSSTRFYTSTFGLIDLKTMSLRQAEDLLKRKAPFIKKKSTSK